MTMFEKIKKWYPNQWRKSQVKDAVAKGEITEEEYEKITGEEYTGTDD